MKRKIDSNNLIPWFTEDQSKLPAAYVASCQRFFLELDRLQADKIKAKQQVPSRVGPPHNVQGHKEK